MADTTLPRKAPTSQTAERIRKALATHQRRKIPLGGYRPAAVTLPLLRSSAGHSVLFTVRTAHVEQHKGEISFPGGRLHPDDDDTLAAALRETWEEVGIRAEDLELLGILDDFISVTGYRVTPYVVYLENVPYDFVPQPREVAEILLVPLRHLRDRAHYHATKPAGSRYHIHHFCWGPYVIWGLTAAILKRFMDLIYGFSDP